MKGFLRRLLGGKDGFVPGRMLEDKSLLRKLVTMDGISEHEQQELYDLVVSPSHWALGRLRALTRIYEARGATYVYDKHGDRIDKSR